MDAYKIFTFFVAGLLLVGCDSGNEKTSASGTAANQSTATLEQKSSGQHKDATLSNNKEVIPLDDTDKKGVPLNITIEEPEPVGIQ